MSIQVTVSDELCTGHGRCYSMSPDVFDSDDEGYCAQRGTTFPVSDDLRADAEVGAESCPQAAITVVGETGGAK